ncbi:GMC oxidoreductase [Deinococcus phoenicis]|uniref:GMC oxidoreductase n=1 Tax=Deinococcus phoenicis TaxID=1476583 RepID=A0A016QUA4_9DEIO|nr:GMC family oxidoreductase [Deinococcus phoenicis]EYB69467.1 GMC oxidoreductase [Deinococcus phoenicis]
MSQPNPSSPLPPHPLLDESQRQALLALVDTLVPALQREDDPHGFYATPGSAAGTHLAAEAYLGSLPERDQAGLQALLGALGSFGLTPDAPQAQREAVLAGVAASSPEAAGGIDALRRLCLMLNYTLVSPEAPNPFWQQFGYGGLTYSGAATERDLPTLVPGDGETLEADVVVVGSGAGGGVIAGELADAGLRVVVLEAGGQYADAELGRSELWAYQNLYWRGGFTPTADGNVSLIAGHTLGGGTTVNWMNCVRTPDEVRREWAGLGLEGVDGPEFDADIASVMARISANDTCSEYNGTHQRMLEGAEKLGYHAKRAFRNADPQRHDPAHAGHIGFGDATGSKQSTLKTYLKDAVAQGARIITRATADRVLTEGSRAAGVAATVLGEDGSPRKITVRAPQVVIACGALETPALLLRSGLGGPAAGDFLRLHPCGALTGLFAEDQQNWWGPAQAAIVDEFAGRTDGYGYLIETTQYTTGLFASSAVWAGPEAHKDLMAQQSRSVTLIHLTRDRGHGRVTLDENGQARVTYAVTDPVDVENYWHGQGTVARLLEAAGAQTIFPLSENARPWTRGEDLEAFIAELRHQPIGRGGHTVFSAHQMGTARMGQDPQTSVADPQGELHDAPGVWIGDTSAFPTSSGANPMITCMALARRTARFVAQAAKAGAEAGHSLSTD